MKFEKLAYRVQNMIYPRPGFACGTQIWEPEPDDFSLLAQLTDRVLRSAQTLLREGPVGLSPVCTISELEEQYLLEYPDDRDVCNLYCAIQYLGASRRAAPQ